MTDFNSSFFLFNNVTRHNYYQMETAIYTICTYKKETVNELFIKSTGTSMVDIQSPARSLSVNIKIEFNFFYLYC